MAAKGMCLGVYSTAPCPTAKLVGTCTSPDTGDLRRYYSEGSLAYDAAGAQKDCTELYSGKWSK